MVEFFIKQHKLINLIVLGVLVIGIYYFIYGQKEGFPNIGLDQIYITTSYPGVSAKDIETLVTRKIEDAIESVEGIDEMISSTTQGLSTVAITANTVETGLELKEIERKIKDEVDLIKTDLPADLPNDPVVKAISFSEVIPIIQVYVTGDASLTELKRVTERFRNEVGQISGISKTEKANYPKTQLWVSVDPRKLKNYEIDISEVVNAIKVANINVPSGTIKTNNEEVLIKTFNPLNEIKNLENVIVRGNDNFQFVRVKDLARSELTPEELETTIEVDGNSGIGVRIYKTRTGDVINVATAVKAKIDEFNKLYPDLNLFYVDDQSFYVERRLNVLANNASIGLVLVFLCIIIFFEFRVSFWTVVGIPVAFCFAIIAAYQIGITLNLMSMFGFIIVLGMIVDDAIIVSENIYQKYEQGMPLMEASIEGTKEMFIPILAITATTTAAFLPLMTLPGIFGKVLGIIPQVVIIAMIASFIEALLCLPGHIGHMKDKGKDNNSSKKSTDNNPNNGFVNAFNNSVFNLNSTPTTALASLKINNHTSDELGKNSLHAASKKTNGKKVAKEKRNWFQNLKARYIKVITAFTRHPVLYSGLTILGLVGIVVGLGSQIPFVFFPGATQTIHLNIELNKKSALKKTQLVVREVEANLRKELGDDISEYISTIGRSKEIDEGKTRRHSYLGHITLNLDLANAINPVKITQVSEKILSAHPLIENYTVIEEVGGPPPGNPVEVILYFNDITKMEEVYQLALKIKDYIAAIPNTSSESVSYEEGKEEIIISPNLTLSSIYGVGLDKFSTVPGSAFRGNVSTTINNFNGVEEEVEVIVKLDEEMVNLNSVSDLELKNRLGNPISMSTVADISTASTTGQISKENGRFSISVISQIENNFDKKYTSQVINNQIRSEFSNWKASLPLVDIEMGGAQKEQTELLRGGVIALLLSVFGVFMVLVSVFKSYSQPFIIMSVLPFITVGVVIGLFLNDVPLGLMPLLGIVALTGVVVNDSLVMVDVINRKRLLTPNRNVRELVIESASERLRAILMTTLTTVVGLIPIAYGIGGDEPFIAPMAISFLWGMIFSTLVMLFLIPNFYLIVDRIAHFVYRLRGKESRFTTN